MYVLWLCLCGALFVHYNNWGWKKDESGDKLLIIAYLPYYPFAWTYLNTKDLLEFIGEALGAPDEDLGTWLK